MWWEKSKLKRLALLIALRPPFLVPVPRPTSPVPALPIPALIFDLRQKKKNFWTSLNLFPIWVIISNAYIYQKWIPLFSIQFNSIQYSWLVNLFL